MSVQKQQAQITELYRRGEFEAAQEKFETLVLFFEENDQTDDIAYWEALLGLGSLNHKNMRDLDGAEATWKKLVQMVDGVEGALELDEESFDIYTQALLLLAFVQKEAGKFTDAELNLKLLRAIAVETRGEKSADVKAIDTHLAGVRKN